MSSNTCPICGEEFGTAGGVRDHAWDNHGACHYCGDEFDGDEQETLYKHWLATHPDDLTKVDRKRANKSVEELTFSDRLENGGVGAAMAGVPRRYVLLAGGAIGVSALGVGATAMSGDGEESNGPYGEGDGNGQAGSTMVPENPSEYDYAVIGSADADLTITYFGSYKCPHCATFSNGFFNDLVAEYVEPGDVMIKFRNLSYFGNRTFLGEDAPAAGHAGLAVWNTDPESYWDYHHYVFENQGQGNWATANTLAMFAKEAGVSDPSAVRNAVENKKYESQLKNSGQEAVSVGIEGTPELLVDGTVVSPSQQGSTRTAIDNALSK